MNYSKYYSHALVVMCLRSLPTWATATGVAPTGLKQAPAPSKQRHTRSSGGPLALSNPSVFGLRLPPAVFALLGNSLPVAVPGGLVPGVSALRLFYPALPCGNGEAPFVMAPEVLKRRWA